MTTKSLSKSNSFLIGIVVSISMLAYTPEVLYSSGSERVTEVLIAWIISAVVMAVSASFLSWIMSCVFHDNEPVEVQKISSEWLRGFIKYLCTNFIGCSLVAVGMWLMQRIQAASLYLQGMDLGVQTDVTYHLLFVVILWMMATTIVYPKLVDGKELDCDILKVGGYKVSAAWAVVTAFLVAIALGAILGVSCA